MGKKVSDMEIWVERYKMWKRSGQTQAEYSRSENIKLSEFKWRIGEARKKGLIGKEEVESSEGKRGPFIAAQVSGSRGSSNGIRTKAAYCEIQFEGSHGVRIESRESMGYLKELMGGVG